jgi:hypothetical protein
MRYLNVFYMRQLILYRCEFLLFLCKRWLEMLINILASIIGICIMFSLEYFNWLSWGKQDPALKMPDGSDRCTFYERADMDRSVDSSKVFNKIIYVFVLSFFASNQKQIE